MDRPVQRRRCNATTLSGRQCRQFIVDRFTGRCFRHRSEGNSKCLTQPHIYYHTINKTARVSERRILRERRISRINRMQVSSTDSATQVYKTISERCVKRRPQQPCAVGTVETQKLNAYMWDLLTGRSWCSIPNLNISLEETD